MATKQRYSISVCWIICVLLLVLTGVCHAGTVAMSFRIPPYVSLDVDNCDIDFGSVDVQDEQWAPVGENNSYKVFVQNNSGGPWEFRVNLLDNLYRIEGVTDLEEDVLAAEHLRWTVVYAGYWDDEQEQQVEARQAGEEDMVPGLQPGTLINDSNTQKGVSFTTIADLSSGVVFRNENLTKSYKYQFVFKFIAKPPASATAGTYTGDIIFTLLTQ